MKKSYDTIDQFLSQSIFVESFLSLFFRFRVLTLAFRFRFFRFVGQNMYRYPDGDETKRNLKERLSGGYEEDRVQDARPHQAHRIYLYVQGNGFLVKETHDVLAQYPVIQQPLVQSLRTPRKQRSRQQQKRRGRQYRQENPRNSQKQTDQTQANIYVFHDRKGTTFYSYITNYDAIRKKLRLPTEIKPRIMKKQLSLSHYFNVICGRSL